MDAELKAAVAEMQVAARRATEAMQKTTEAATASTTAANAATAAANAATAAVHNLGIEVRTLRRDFGVLWRRVHGSDPPPPPGDPTVAPVVDGEPLDELVRRSHETASEVSLEVAALEGRMIREFGAVRDELAKQSTAMGLKSKGFFEALATRSGRKDLIAVLTLVAAMVATYATIRTGQQQPPPASAPTTLAVPAASR